jgi:hypothetical protein
VSCRHRVCVSPGHLVERRRGGNLLASAITIPSINARKTHCPEGHPYDEANTYLDAKGCRHCRSCDRQRKARRLYEELPDEEGNARPVLQARKAGAA